MKQKPKRLKLIREDLEAQLDKYSRRIQTLAENAYKVRQMLEQLNAMPKRIPIKKGEVQSNAIYQTGSEGSISEGGTDTNSGESELPCDPSPETVLGEQQ